MNHRLQATLRAVALATAGVADAHVTLQPATAQAGASIKAAFVVSHGCGKEPTSAVIVKIPEGVTARAMAKANWIITVRKTGDRVSEVQWRGGSLNTELYDEFTLVVRVPDTAGKRYYFPVRQECEEGTMDWTEVPAEGKTTRDYKTPAAELEVVPAAAGAGEAGHKH